MADFILLWQVAIAGKFEELENIKNRYRLILIFVLLSLLSGQIGRDERLWANSRYESSYLIQATPFDAKLASVGFFDSSKTTAKRVPRAASSIQGLFLTARSFRYAPHAADDRWQTPQETFAKKSGNCADKAVWLYKQLEQNGYPYVRLVIGKYGSVDPLFHVWVTYADRAGDTYLLDPTIQRQAWKMEIFPEKTYKPFYSFGDGNRYRN